MAQKNEIVLYQPDEAVKIEVRLENETVWLTQQQMAELFQTTRNNVTLHINNVFKEQELLRESVCKDSLHTATDGKKYKTKLYNLEKVLKKYCLKEHAISTVAKFATVQSDGGGHVRRLVEYSRIAGV